MDLSYDCIDSAVTTSDVTSGPGEAAATDESAGGAAGVGGTENGVKKGRKRKRKTRRGRKNKVYVAADVGRGEDAPQARWGGYGLYERFQPWQNDCEDMNGFFGSFYSGIPEFLYFWCPNDKTNSRPAFFHRDLSWNE